MKDHLHEFENPRRDPEKTKWVIEAYAILLLLVVAAIVRAWYKWKRITHH